MQRVYKDLIRNFPKEGENIEDKKVDDKPMVIHTKEKAKIHSHEPKGARIKGSNIYTVERGSKIAGAKAAETTGKKSYRKSTAYQANVKEKGLSRFKRIVREANASIKTKNTNLHIAVRTGALAAGTVTDQVEGGQEVTQAAYLAYETSRLVTGTASKGAALFRRKAAEQAKRRIKKVEAGKKLAKKAAKTATKTAAAAAGTAVAPIVGLVLLLLVLVVAMVALPVVAVIAVLYNSPFALFLPLLESGDTVQTVTSAYVQEFNRDVNTKANEHTGYDLGEIVYVDYEGMEENPSNYYDIMAVYMVKHGVGDTATVMNDTSKGWLQAVVNDMCSYTTSIDA